MSQKLDKSAQKKADLEATLAHPLLPLYLGPNAEQYIALWQEHVITGKYTKTKVGVKLAILFILSWPTWFAYRKMYMAALIIFLVIIALSTLIVIFLPNVSSGLGVGTTVAIMSSAKMMYQERVVSFFKKYGHLPESEILPLIQKHGGTSTLGATLVTIAFVLFTLFAIAMVIIAARLPS